MSRNDWTDKEVSEARAMRGAGKTMGQIGAALGRSARGVQKKLAQVDGWDKTPSIINPMAEAKFAAAMAGSSFEDARVPREARPRLSRPETTVYRESPMTWLG